MKSPLNRRQFVMRAGTVAGASLLPPALSQTTSSGPQVLVRRDAKPVVVASDNGNKWKDRDGLTCVARAFKLMTEGSDVLDAVIAGVNIVELEPDDTSVGYGGLPNADGVVQLDASVMHGPTKRAGAVACLEGVRTPSLVAKAVLEQTDHHLLVGGDAQRFARQMGFRVENDLNTEKSRRLWIEWKRRIDPQHFLDPKKRADAGERARRQMVAGGMLDAAHVHGTINCNAVNAKGEIAGVTTTSGLAFKIPGRVGDSPILGAGLYVDGEIGAAGSTGRGEANLFSLCSFLIVEAMRSGRSPKDAGMDALKRVVAATVEKRLLNSRGQPNFGLNFYIVNARGEHAGVSLYGRRGGAAEGPRYALATEAGPQSLLCESLLDGAAAD